MTGDRQHCNRVNLIDVKNLITKKLGSVQAEKYFNLITRFLSKKLNKSDFHKFCIVAVGRENISLHNMFIKSMLKNATFSTTPPPKPINPEFPSITKPCYGSCLQALIPKPPRKGRTPVVHEKRKHPSPLGPQGKPETVTYKEQQSSIITIENREEVDQSAVINNKRPCISAPFGVQYSAKVAEKRARTEICRRNRELPDTSSLMTSLVQKLKDEGISVPLEYAAVLNLSLDVYLKKVCEPCVVLAKAQANARIRASYGELRAAVELNPTVLGENWPVHLETVTQQHDLEMKDKCVGSKIIC